MGKKFFSKNLKNILFIYFWREGKEGTKRRRETMWERNMDQLPLLCASSGDQTSNLGICPDWESNWRPFTLQAAQQTELHWSGQGKSFTKFYFNSLISLQLLSLTLLYLRNYSFSVSERHSKYFGIWFLHRFCGQKLFLTNVFNGY